MIPYEKTCEDCLKEMFKRVGEKYPNPKLTSQKDWYMKRAWTPEQEDCFREWMRKLLKRRYRTFDERHIGWEVGMFMLSWGWKTDPSPWEAKKDTA